MSLGEFSQQSTTKEKIVPYRLRTDLIFQKQNFGNKTYYIVKDPLGLSYYRFPPQEAFLATLFDGKRTTEEIAEIFNAHWPHRRINPAEVLRFASILSRRNLTILPVNQWMDQLPRKTSSFLYQLSKIFVRIFFIKFPLVRPSSWLDRIVHRLWWLWSFQGVVLTVCFWLLTLLFLFFHRSTFITNQIQFFSPQNIFLLYLAIVIDKSLHEFGHATTCRRFGGEIHEMGVGLFFFIPVGYVDASDSWVIPDKKARIFVSLAGVYTELIVASIASYFWVFLPLGLAKNLAFNLMVTASVTTLFFNFNPLMKFDGYYALVDLLEIPNLREKSFVYCTAKLQEWLLGYKDPSNQGKKNEAKKEWIFFSYSILATVYMAYLCHSIGQVVRNFLTPIGLERIGEFLGFSLEIAFVMAILLRIFFQPLLMITKAKGIKKNASKLQWVAIGGIALGILCMVPVREKVQTVGVVRSDFGQNVASPDGGLVQEIWVYSGEQVKPGQPLLKLRNDKVETETQLARLDLALKMVGFSNKRTFQQKDEEASKSKEIQVMKTRYDYFLKKKEQLFLRSSVDGIIVSPNVESLKGRYFKAGETILKIRDMHHFSFVAPLNQSQSRIVYPGAEVKGIWISTKKIFHSHVAHVSQKMAEVSEFDPGHLIPFGGKVPLIPSSIKKEYEKNPFYFAYIPVESPSQFMVEGLRAKLVIKGRKTILGKKIYRFLTALLFNKSEE
jgi:putative peptide zinc metalloprotease protein